MLTVSRPARICFCQIDRNETQILPNIHKFTASKTGKDRDGERRTKLAAENRKCMCISVSQQLMQQHTVWTLTNRWVILYLLLSLTHTLTSVTLVSESNSFLECWDFVLYLWHLTTNFTFLQFHLYCSPCYNICWDSAAGCHASSSACAPACASRVLHKFKPQC